MLRQPCSEQCSLASLDLFSVPATQVGIESGVFDNVRSHPQFQENTTILFDIPADTQRYICLNQTELWLTVRLMKKTPGSHPVDANFTNSTAPATIADVAPVNNLIHSLFKQVEISLNGKEVESSSSNYAYKAYIGFLQFTFFFKFPSLKV
jgi:hypothetical protein